MIRIRSIRALLGCALIALPLSSSGALRAEPLPPELNLVPRDAALFVSIRVGDLWNDASVKPLRDFLAKDASIIRNFEKDNGYRPDLVERVTVFIPSFDSDRGPEEPWVIVTLTKPYDLEKMLEGVHGMTPADARRFKEKPRFDSPPKPIFKGPPSFGKDFDLKSPLKSEPKFEFEKKPRLEKKELVPPPKEFERNQEPIFFARDDNDPPIAKKNSRPRDLKASYYVLRDGGFLVPISDRTVILCMGRPYRDSSAIPELLASLLRRSDDGPLASALEAATGKHAMVMGVNLPAIKNALPRDGWSDVLPFDSILSSRSATMTLDVGDELKFALRVDSPDAATAKRAHDVLKAIHVLGMEMLPGLKKKALGDDGTPVKLLLAFVEPLLKSAEFEQKGSATTMTMTMKADAAWAKAIADAIENVRRAADSARDQNNLKQMGLAIHNYASASDGGTKLPFPGESAPKGQHFGGHVDKNPNLSWRVTILPYIEQGQLYQEFHFDEPWDSEHNKKLIPKMPKLFAPPANIKVQEGHTFCRVFSGDNAVGGGKYQIHNIPDGTSNTIFVVEAGESTPWTKPDTDFIMDWKKPLPILGGHFKDRMNVLMGDGSVRMIDLKKISEKTLKLAICPDDGTPLPSDW